MTEGSFHKGSTCTGTTGKIYLLRMDLQPRVPDFSFLPPFDRKALEQIHEGHQGMEKCMLKARESVYWPGISDDICEAVEKCGICQSTSRAAKPVGNISEVPPHAWHTLGTDLFYWNRMDFLVVGDYFTKFLIMRKIPNTSTHSW